MMTGSEAFLQPDQGQMLTYLEHLFHGDLYGLHDGLVEIAWTDPTPDPALGRPKLRHAKLFGTDELDAAAEWAAHVNATPGVNVYVGMALRHPTTPRGRRAGKADVWGASALWGDWDEPGAAERAWQRCAFLRPTAVKITGRIPHLRSQADWRLEEPIQGVEAIERALAGLQAALEGDPTVVDAARVMRLPGSIAWPHKPGRVAELTAVKFNPKDAVYDTNRVLKAFPPPTGQTGGQGEFRSKITGKLKVEELLATVRAGNWHGPVRDAVGHMVGMGYPDWLILGYCERLTLQGWSVERTRAEVAELIKGAREKLGIADPGDEFEEEAELRAEPFQPFDPATLPRRRWILGHRYLRGVLTLTIAPGGVGKSTLTLQEAIAIVLGKSDLTGDEVHESGPVWVWNNEDPQDELHRRVAAICQNWEIQLTELRGKLFLNSGLNRRLIVAKELSGAVVATPDVEGLIAEIRRHDIAVLIVDPFVRSHRVEENDNAAIDFVAEQFVKVAMETGCAIGLVHHTRKPPAGSSEGHAGSADAGRGASALVNAVRIADTLMGMSERDAENLGIPEGERRLYVRLDGAKANLAAPAERVRWFRLKGVELPNGKIGPGDEVGILEPAEIGQAESVSEELETLARMMAAQIIESGLTVSEVARRIAWSGGEEAEHPFKKHRQIRLKGDREYRYATTTLIRRIKEVCRAKMTVGRTRFEVYQHENIEQVRRLTVEEPTAVTDEATDF